MVEIFGAKRRHIATHEASTVRKGDTILARFSSRVVLNIGIIGMDMISNLQALQMD